MKVVKEIVYPTSDFTSFFLSNGFSYNLYDYFDYCLMWFPLFAIVPKGKIKYIYLRLKESMIVLRTRRGKFSDYSEAKISLLRRQRIYWLFFSPNFLMPFDPELVSGDDYAATLFERKAICKLTISHSACQLSILHRRRNEKGNSEARINAWGPLCEVLSAKYVIYYSARG